MADKKPAPAAAEPTRRTVEALLRDVGAYCSYDYDNTRPLRNEREELIKELIDVPAVRALDRRIRAAELAEQKRSKRFKAMRDEVRLLYQAEGLTDRVKKAAVRLAEAVLKANGGEA